MYSTRKEAIRFNTAHPEYATFDELYVGARVECVGEYDNCHSFNGKTGTIVDLYTGYNAQLISVSWDDWNKGHDGGFTGVKTSKNSSCWNSKATSGDLILLDTVPKTVDPTELFALLD